MIDSGPLYLKCHSFLPSGRIIWTMIGNNYEYWLDPYLNYCSCNDYYFRTLSGKGLCYHLNFAHKNVINKNFEQIYFHDEEYLGFISAIISDCYSKLHKQSN